jgi:hypothetical protein
VLIVSRPGAPPCRLKIKRSRSHTIVGDARVRSDSVRRKRRSAAGRQDKYCYRFKSHILHAFASRPSLDSNGVLAPNCSMRKMPGWVLLFLVAALLPAPFILAQSWWARALLAIALWGYLLMLLGIFMASHPRGEARNPRAPRTPS